MKLNELHIADATTRTPSHSDAVTGRRIGVTGVAIDLTYPTSCQHYGLSSNGLYLIGIDVQRIHAIAAVGAIAFFFGAKVAIGDQIQRNPMFQNGDVGVGSSVIQ